MALAMPILRSAALLTATAGVLLLGGGMTTAQADWIGDWNQAALEAGRDSSQLSPEMSRSMAMLNTAIYNAVEGIAGNYNLYTQGSYTGPSGTAVSGASMQAASSAAAYTILADLYPSMAGTFSTLYGNQLGSLANDQALIDGINFGTLVANDILNWRSSDGASDASDPGLYSPVGSAGYFSEAAVDSALLPGWGNVATFAIPGTPSFNGSLGMSNSAYIATGAYATDYNNVKSLGASVGSSRDSGQTDAAHFWQGAQGTVTNVGLWNAVAESIVTTQSLSLADTARLYAALNVALADASIVAMDTRYEVDFWTPQQAIQNGGADGNGATIADPGWTPLQPSLEMPSYFDERGILAGAATGILEQFAGNSYSFLLESDPDGDGNPDLSFNFSSLAAALDQAKNSAVWSGTNFQKAADDGAVAGGQIATEVMNNQFAAVPEPAGALLVLIAGVLGFRRRR